MTSGSANGGGAGLRALLARSGWLFGDRVVRLTAGFATSVLLARNLAPESFGGWVYAISFALLFLPLSTLGLERIAVREFAREQAREGVLLGTLWLLRLIGGVFGAVSAGAVAWWLTESAGPDVRWLIVLLAAANVFLAFDVIDWRFQANGELRPTTVARCAVFLLGSASRVVLAWQHAPILWLAYATIGELALSAALQVIVYWRGGGRFRGVRVEPEVGRLLLRAGAPLLFAELAVFALLKLDLIILGASASAEETGFYGAATRLAQVAYFLPVVAVQVFSPQIARCADDGEALALTQRVMNLLVASALGLALGLCFGAPWFVRILFGREYSSVAPLVAVMAWSTVFAFMGSGHSLYLANRGYQNTALLLNLIGSVTSVTLFAIMIPRWGAMGAAISGVLAGGLATVPSLWLMPASRALIRVDILAFRWVFGAPLRLVHGWLRSAR